MVILQSTFADPPKPNERILSVSDDGGGIESSSDGEGLGKMIIRGLASQLDAQVSYKNENGTTVTVKFPIQRMRHR